MEHKATEDRQRSLVVGRRRTNLALPNKGMKLTNLAVAPELVRRRRGVRPAGMERTGSQLIPDVRPTWVSGR